MESPNKRVKTSSPTLNTGDDFVPLGSIDGEGFTPANGTISRRGASHSHPRESQTYAGHRGHNGNFRATHSRASDHHRAADRPKSKHPLPGHEPWILVKTKLRRRFVHNTETKQSFWRIPADVLPGVVEFEQWERVQKEKAQNAKWAEEQLKQMREQSKADVINKAADREERGRRRRSESLQREDEEALMAELAAQAEQAEEEDVKETVAAVQSIQPQQHGPDYDSDSSYEEVEVTDSEFEDEPDQAGSAARAKDATNNPEQSADNAPIEFGEDDIAYQLAAMGDDYGLDPGEYGDADEEWDEGEEGLLLSEEDAVHLFRDLLDDYHVSPFTPWEKIIADESESSILNDDRYTVLSTMKARKDAWDDWARDKAAELKHIRATMEKQDPKIPYLDFLQDKATPKLYWPEFKRKYKREAEMNERKLSDKDREKMYREHVNRLKLPESARKADLDTLLRSIPLKLLNRNTTLDSLPQPLISHLHYISLPKSTRDTILASFIKRLPPAPESDDMTEEERKEEERRREERRRREKALADRERRVEEEDRQHERDKARAVRDLREEERVLQQATVGNTRNSTTHIGSHA